MSGTVAFLILLLAARSCYAIDYVVGGASGWDTSGDYSTWVSGKTFNVGDTLLFSYGASHSVDEVNKADYDACTSTNSINSYNDGNTTLTLNKTGPYYFICPTSNHCGLGMKLAINVVSAATSPAPAAGSPPSTTAAPTSPPPSTTAPPPSTTTPSPSSSTAPSPVPSSSSTPPADLAPDTPTSSKTPTTPSPSDSGAMGSFKRMDAFVLGASLVFAQLLVLLMG